MGQGSAQPDCSNAPVVRTVPLAPWTFHNEQDVCFKVTEELGQGAFGKVLGVTLGPHGNAAALKLLGRNPVRVDEDVHMHKEIQALTDLSHPCIVQLFGVVFTTFNVQLFLQRHEMSLHQYLANGGPGGPTEAQAKQIAVCILGGLAHMHAAGYVHRDLKPANILVNCHPLVAVISDLGSAHLGEDARDLATTLTVRAPEIMLGDAYRKACDIWSLGCIFAQVEQEAFFDGLHRDVEKKGSSLRATEFFFMQGLARKLCPCRTLAFTIMGERRQRLCRDLLTLGHVGVGVLGKRFRQPSFQLFMEQMLDFQPTVRATAENLQQHPWLQTVEPCQPLSATS
jgi:serine/threonine protein kinase